MKKLFLMMLAVPFLMATSCDDDNDLPNVDVAVNFQDVTRVDDVIYVVQGEPLTVESITLEDHTKKGAVIGGAEFFWDYEHLLSTIVQPYKMTLDTEGILVGNHLFQIAISIYAVDYSPCEGYMAYKVKVVESADDIPSDGDTEPNPSIAAAIRATGDKTK